MSEAPALIHLENVSKVFYTDEVETHALDEVTLDIYPGEYVAISGPSVAGSRPCCRSWDCSTRRPRATIR